MWACCLGHACTAWSYCGAKVLGGVTKDKEDLRLRMVCMDLVSSACRA